MSAIFPIEPLNTPNPKYEESRGKDFNYFKSKSKLKINYRRFIKKKI